MKINIQGQLVDISHLKKIDRVMTLDLRGGYQKKNARLTFRFSCHCYSRGPVDDEVIPIDMFIPDGSTVDPRDRIFCWDRYRHSLSLVQRIDTLIATNGLVRRSRHLNFFSTEIIRKTVDGIEVPTSYYIFMDAKKKQDKNQPPRIDIFVESAYPEDPNIPSPFGEKEMPLSAMLGNVWMNGSIR